MACFHSASSQEAAGSGLRKDNSSWWRTVIVSVSRRTDIPAFYSQWFLNRLQAGEVLIRNPFNANQVSRVILNKEWVDYFVFWTIINGLLCWQKN